VRKGRTEAGFSLIEALVVIAIVLVMAATAIIQIGPRLKSAKTDTALATALGQLRQYHEAAVDQRHVYRVSFMAPRTIQVDQMTFDSSGNQVFTFINSIDLPIETQFACIEGIPTSQSGVPDGLGNGKTAIDFSLDHGGGGTAVFFQKDGRATDSAGRLNDGVVYIAQTGELSSSKALSVLGATGRIKGWRLTVGSNSTSVWHAL
jgi:prepilin-type N-terminal cleavage/methylation domain-containing protein